jgi:hypothetical protein
VFHACTYIASAAAGESPFRSSSASVFASLPVKSARKRISCLSFPHVCPERVLAKRSLFSIEWRKGCVFLPGDLSGFSAQSRLSSAGHSDRGKAPSGASSGSGSPAPSSSLAGRALRPCRACGFGLSSGLLYLSCRKRPFSQLFPCFVPSLSW